jgi:hypothetical protein
VCSSRCAPRAWWGEVPVANLKVLGHLVLEHLFQNGLHALADSSLDIQLYVVLNLVLFRAQVSLSSLETHNLPDAIAPRISQRRTASAASSCEYAMGGCGRRSSVGLTQLQAEPKVSW